MGPPGYSRFGRATLQGLEFKTARFFICNAPIFGKLSGKNNLASQKRSD